MKPVSSIFLWLLWMLIVTAIVVAMAMYDRFIRWLHTNRKEEWQELGMPTGYLFKPEGVTFWRSDMKKTELAQQWFFDAPEWITGSQELRRALWIYRGAGLCAIGGMVTFGLLLK